MRSSNTLMTLLGFIAITGLFAMAQTPYQDPGDRNPPPYSPGFEAHDCNDPDNVLGDCGFESGAFGTWTAQDLAAPFFPLGIAGAGLSPGFGLFTSAPTEGGMALVHGFDGAGPGFIRTYQEVIVPSGASLQFDYRAGWDYTFGTPTQSRVFRVVAEPAGGGAALFSQDVFTADIAIPTLLDTGDLHGNVDLSSLTGQNIRLIFEWEIPENFTGPGFFQLDNVLLEQTLVIPTLSEYGLGLFVVLLCGTAVYFLRKRRVGTA